MGHCNYFRSSDWQQRLSELEGDVVNLKMTIWAASHIDDSETALEDLVANLEGSRRNLGEKEVIETLSEVPDDVIEWNGQTLGDARDSMVEVPESCPHQPVEGSDRCVFHMSSEERNQHDITATDVRDKFLQKVTEGGAENKNFTGANFDELDLEQQSLSSEDNYPIRLVGCDIDGLLNLNQAVVNQPLDLSGAQLEDARFIDAHFRRDVEFWGTSFRGDVSFKYCLFDSDAEFWNAQFKGEVSFYASSFAEYAEFRDAEFESDTLFKYTNVDRDVEFWDCLFRGEANFESMSVRDCAEFRFSTFTDESNFESVTIDDRVEFQRVRFEQDVTLAHLKVGGDAHFWGTEFHGDAYVRASEFGGYLEFKEGDLNDDGKSAVFHDRAYFRYSSVAKDTEFWGVEFHGEADFRNIEFNGTTEFQYSVFHDTVNFSGSRHTWIDFTEVIALNADVEFTDNKIPAGTITQPSNSATYYNMTEAVLGDLTLIAEKDADLFDYFKFYETDFDSFPFPEYRRALNKDWAIHRYREDSYLENYDKLESTYLKAKNGANEVGDSKAASEFFLRELKYQRKDRFQNFKDASSIREKSKHLFYWSGNWMYNVTCGYGERPFRTVSFSFVIILLFTGIYSILGVEFQSGEGIVRFLIFSLQTFVALIVGGTTPTNQTRLVQLLSSLEAFFGAFTIALFVFALTRSLHR